MRKSRKELYRIVDARKPYLNAYKYFGYKLYYTRGSGLIERIRFGSTNRVYEPELLHALVKEISSEENPILFDIGTNIGLISTALLASCPKLKIYGFEPSPIAYKSLSTTIFANRLEDRIELFDAVLGDKNQPVSFSLHEEKDCSGDGLIDTGRAERPAEKTITKQMTTLDSWWQDNGRPAVTVIKIDIEGAELLAFRGAENVLREQKPVIYLEIAKENLRVYPYNENDVFAFLDSHGYSVFTHDGKPCTEKNISEMVKETDTFMARPR